MNNKYMGVMTAESQRMVAAPNQQMMSQQHLGMLQTSFISNSKYRADKALREKEDKIAQKKNAKGVLGKLNPNTGRAQGFDIAKYNSLMSAAKQFYTQNNMSQIGNRNIGNEQLIRSHLPK